MTIKHANYQAIQHIGMHVVTLPSEVIRAIGSADALAIWTYLQTMAETWKPKAAEIKRSLGLGADRYKKGMDRLRELGLVYDAVPRDENGKIYGKTLVCIGIPENMHKFRMLTGNQATKKETTTLQPLENNRTPENTEHREKPYFGKTHNSENPNFGKSDPLSTDQVLSTDQEREVISAPDDAHVNAQFDLLWKAWPNKKNKKRAQSDFKRFFKGKSDNTIADTVKTLIRDAQARLAANQLGFSEMMLSTYLNNERFNDDLPNQAAPQQPKTPRWQITLDKIKTGEYRKESDIPHGYQVGLKEAWKNGYVNENDWAMVKQFARETRYA